MSHGTTLSKNLAFAIVLIFATTSGAIAAENLSEAKTIRIQSLTPDIPVATLKANYTYSCTYKKGLFFPETESCGSKTLEVNVGQDGTIQLPAVKNLGGFHGGKKDNYRFNLTVVRPLNGHTHEMLFSLSGRGQRELELFENFNEVITFARIKGANLSVTVERRALLGSDLAQLPNVHLMVARSSTQDDKFQGLLLYSTFKGLGEMFENKVWSNGSTPRRQLAELNQISLPDMVYAFTGNLADQQIGLHVWLDIQQSEGSTPAMFESRVDGKVDADFLKENANVDLKSVPKK